MYGHKKLGTVFSFTLALLSVLTYGVINGESAFACNISNKGLNEASGLAASIKHPGIVYTHNDEKGPIFAIDASTCRVAGKFTVNGLRSDPDPEAITVDHKTGKVWFGDIGNGHPTQPKSMTSKDPKIKHRGWPARILVFDEPTSLSGSINPQVVDITYQGGDHNSEALLSNPKTGQGYIIGKYAQSKVFKLPNPLKSGQATLLKLIEGWVTDATFTNDGKWILVRYRTTTDPAPTNVRVYDGATWNLVGSISVPRVPQGESITVEKDGQSFLVGSEGTNSPLVRVALPAQYASTPADTDISGPDCQARGRTWITGTGCERDCKDGAGNLLFPTTTRSICKNAGIAYGILGMTKTQCQDLDRRELAVPNTKYCAKRWDQKTVANAPQCEDPKAGYARFTYIHDASGDYCGYW